MHLPPAYLARSVHFGGIRRNACTYSRRLITRRSQVQILPPLLGKAPETAPFLRASLRSRLGSTDDHLEASRGYSRLHDIGRIRTRLICGRSHLTTSVLRGAHRAAA